MATFPNVDGLTAVNGDAYQASQASGDLQPEDGGHRRRGHARLLDAGSPPPSTCRPSSPT